MQIQIDEITATTRIVSGKSCSDSVPEGTGGKK
jgi:hypothetical protein